MMKKIISIVCVIAMLFAFAVTSNAAAANGVTIEKVAQDATTATYEVYLNTTEPLYGYSIYLDLAAAIDAGIPNSTAGVAVTAANGTTAKFSKKLIVMSYANLSGEESAMFAGGKLCTIVLDTTNMTGAFDITKATSKPTSINKYTDEDGKIDVTSEYTIDLTVTVEMFAAEFEPETVKATAVASSQNTFDFAKSASYTDTYTNIGVYTASIAAAKKSEAGFIWVKDGVETAHKFPFDVEDVAGGGAFDYTVAMYGIPTGVTITAIPYYVTAE